MFKPTNAATPEEYIAQLDDSRKEQIRQLDALIRKTVPELKPFMLAGMLAYGKYHYRYASGKEGDWAVILLANQKNYISLYACAIVDGQYVAEKYKEKLPKASIGKSCIRFKKIEDIDLDVIKEILLEAKDHPLSAV